MKTLLHDLKGIFLKDWWIEILTNTPDCIYYFGPFKDEAEASKAKAGYIEDLTQEGAIVSQISVMKRPTPAQLTFEYSSDFSTASVAES
ncbi:hypothetical protein N836_02935 [Leptolyngbya sp. Heron Island J]|uniref:DUF1816 domain-containing protein n=1 Tax=Leptolyngbya sp. Heron Island J TaxID=1385935 RepID=UPI0003B9EA6C|nr:DUF1816 domain-containing protein [Leptolyngbya sp. Heron Island J]ESA37485.1 hypothetical protein N836_02935 [Leptolyngbya sp. Heron Island J]